jgi:hypothetical protein
MISTRMGVVVGLRRLSAGLLLAGLLALPGSAAAANVACFDWSCDPNGSGACTFNAGCTQLTQGSLWRYSWSWGDGTGDLTGNNIIGHNYGTVGCGSPLVRLTVIPFSANEFSVQCYISYRDCVGPPIAQFSGRCQ